MKHTRHNNKKKQNITTKIQETKQQQVFTNQLHGKEQYNLL
ncbi:hypothetical protein HS9_00313 [Bacillus velezensis]|nr:hypothetical protein HS9_00313 [Bacillus velezensis]